MRTTPNIEFVGREKYLRYLQEKIDVVEKGRAKVVVLSGETGVGKTRIVEEFLKKLPESAMIMRTEGIAGLSLPYSSIKKALESQGLGSLLKTARNPRVEAIFAVTKSGLVVSKLEREKTLDTDILMGMLNAVGAFVRESLAYIQNTPQLEEAVHSMRYGSFNLISVPGKHINLVAVLTGKENENLIFEMDEILRNIEEENRSMLQNWDGNIGKTAVLTKYFSVLLTDGRYAGEQGEAGVDRLNLYENILHGISRKAEERKVILFIDDLQWADLESLEVIKFLIRNCGELALFVVCTYNENANDVKIEKEALEQLAKEGNLEFLKIEGFEEKEFFNFLSRLLEHEVDDEVVSRIYSQTQGNPMFTIEFLKEIENEEEILGDLDKNLPKKIYEIMLARLNRLTREDLEVLQCSAVVGYDFALSTVARLMESSKLSILRRMSALETLQFVVRIDENHYRFSHPLLKDAIYSSMDWQLKNAYHEYLAQILEAEYLAGDHESLLPMIEHYLASRIASKIEEYALVSAKYAIAHFAQEKAIEILKKSLAIVTDRDKKIEMLNVLVDALETASNFNEEIEFIDKLISMLEESGDKRGIAFAWKKRGEANIAVGNYAEALKDVERALSLEIDKTLYGSLLCLKGLVHERMAEHTEAVKYYEEALEALRTTEARSDLAYAYMRLGTASSSLGKIEEAERYLMEALAIYTATGDMRGISATSNNLGEFYRALGEREKARENYLKALEIDRKTGDRRGLSVVYSSLGDIALDYEEFGTALKNYRESLKICRRIDNKYGIAWNLCGIAECLARTGQLNEVVANLSSGFEIATRINAMDVVGWAYRVYALNEELSGNTEEAALLYEKSVRIYESAGMEIEKAKTLCEYGRMLVEIGKRVEHGVEILREARRIFAEKRAKNYLTKCESVLSKLGKQV